MFSLPTSDTKCGPVSAQIGMKIAKDQMLAIVLNKIVGKNIKIIDEILLNFLGWSGAKEW